MLGAESSTGRLMCRRAIMIAGLKTCIASRVIRRALFQLADEQCRPEILLANPNKYFAQLGGILPMGESG